MACKVSWVVAAALLSNATLADAQSLSGVAGAVDGDTLSFSGTLVHLAGIDAIERRQRCMRGGAAWDCGDEARRVLADLVAGKPVKCIGDSADDRRRIVARCEADGRDLAEAMVLAGYAVSTPEASTDYSEFEDRARTFAQGAWAGEFERPAQWRIAHPDAAPTPEQFAAAAPVKPKVYRNNFGCAIKGNQSYRGDWIYYLPGQPYYDQTRPEALFCTEAAAEAAGYRPTRAR